MRHASEILNQASVQMKTCREAIWAVSLMMRTMDGRSTPLEEKKHFHLYFHDRLPRSFQHAIFQTLPPSLPDNRRKSGQSVLVLEGIKQKDRLFIPVHTMSLNTSV